MRVRKGLLTLIAAMLVTVSWAWPAQSDILINGAGATFPYPIYSKWFDVYAKENPGVHFNYQSIGSGAGIRMFGAKTVAFGASDAPMTDQQIAAVHGQVFHFPTVMGADVIAYHVPGFKGTLRLTGPVIADIFMGKIKKWNDPAITALNPGSHLPDKDIVVCHRSDGSGTTYIFADYLSKVSPAWAKDMGKSTSLTWPVGLGGKGNEGVTALVEETPNSIGYIELIYALSNHIPFAKIRNRDGKWLMASLKGVTAAAAGAANNMPKDFRVSITEEPGPNAYPISSFTYLLIYPKYTDKTKGEAVKKFINWELHEGQKYAPALNYAPLPPQVVKLEEAQLKKVVVEGE
jgi:phosphate transport system substrate-binding protein